MAKAKPDPRVQVIQTLSSDIAKDLEDRFEETMKEETEIEKLRKKVAKRRKSDEGKATKGQLVTKSDKQKEVEGEEDRKLDAFVEPEKWKKRSARWKECSALLWRVLDDPELASEAVEAWTEWSGRYYCDPDSFDSLALPLNLVAQHHRQTLAYLWSGHIVPRLEAVAALERKSASGKRKAAKAGTSLEASTREKVTGYLRKVEAVLAPLLKALSAILPDELVVNGSVDKKAAFSEKDGDWASLLAVILEDETAERHMSTEFRGKIASLLVSAAVHASLLEGGVDAMKDMKVLGFARLSNLLMQSRSAAVSLNLMRTVTFLMPETKGGVGVEQAVSNAFSKDVWPEETRAKILVIAKGQLRGPTTRPIFFSCLANVIASLPDEPNKMQDRPYSTTLQSLIINGREIIDGDVVKSPHSGPRLFIDQDVILVTYFSEEEGPSEHTLEMASVRKLKVTNTTNGMSVFSFEAKGCGDLKGNRSSLLRIVELSASGSDARSFAEQMRRRLKPEQQDPSFKGGASIPPVRSQPGRDSHTSGLPGGLLGPNVKAATVSEGEPSRRQEPSNGSNRAPPPNNSKSLQEHPSHVSDTDPSGDSNRVEVDAAALGNDVKGNKGANTVATTLSSERRDEGPKKPGASIVTDKSTDIIIPETSTSTSGPPKPLASPKPLVDKPRTPLGMRHANKPPSTKAIRTKQRSDTTGSDALAPSVAKAPVKRNTRQGSVAPTVSRDATPGGARGRRAATRAAKEQSTMPEVIEEDEEEEEEEGEGENAGKEEGEALGGDAREAKKEISVDPDQAHGAEQNAEPEVVQGKNDGESDRAGKESKGKGEEIVVTARDEPSMSSQQLRQAPLNKASTSTKRYGKSKESPRYKMDSIGDNGDEQEEEGCSVQDNVELVPTSPASPNISLTATSKATAPFKPLLPKAAPMVHDGLQKGRREWSEPLRAAPLVKVKTAPEQLQHCPLTNKMASPEKHAIVEDLRGGHAQANVAPDRKRETKNQPVNTTSKKTVPKPIKPAEDDVFSQSLEKGDTRSNHAPEQKTLDVCTEAEDFDSDVMIQEAMSQLPAGPPKESAKNSRPAKKPLVQPRPKNESVQVRAAKSRSKSKTTPVPQEVRDFVPETQEPVPPADKGKSKEKQQKKAVEKEVKTRLPRRGAAVRADEALEETYMSDGGEAGMIDEAILDAEDPAVLDDEDEEGVSEEDMDEDEGEDGVEDEEEEEPEPEITKVKPKSKLKSESTTRKLRAEVVLPRAKSRLSEEADLDQQSEEDNDEAEVASSPAVMERNITKCSRVTKRVEEPEMDAEDDDSDDGNYDQEDDQEEPRPVSVKAQPARPRQTRLSDSKTVKKIEPVLKISTKHPKNASVKDRKRKKQEEEEIQAQDAETEDEELKVEVEEDVSGSEEHDEDEHDDQESVPPSPLPLPPTKRQKTSRQIESVVEREEEHGSVKRARKDSRGSEMQPRRNLQTSSRPAQSIRLAQIKKPVSHADDSISDIKPVESRREVIRRNDPNRSESQESTKEQAVASETRRTSNEKKNDKTIHASKPVSSDTRGRVSIPTTDKRQVAGKRKSGGDVGADTSTRKKARFAASARDTDKEGTENTAEIFQILNDINLAVCERVKHRLEMPSKRQRATFRDVSSSLEDMNQLIARHNDSQAIWQPIVDAQEQSDAELHRVMNQATLVLNEARKHSRVIQKLLAEEPVFLLDGMENIIE